MFKNPFKVIKEKIKQKSKKPWFDFQTSGVPGSDGQVEIKMDWNAAFINNLRDMGFTGMTEEEIVQKYIKALTKNPEPNPYTPNDDPEPTSINHPDLSRGHYIKR